jgi:hypothetical protein
MLAVTQLLMWPTEIVGTAHQVHPRLKGLQPLSGMSTFARQRSQPFAHGSIEAFNQRGIELLTSRGHGEQVLRLLKHSPAELACHFHHPFLLRLLDNSGNTELWPDF